MGRPGPVWACSAKGTVLLGGVALLISWRPQFLWPFLLAPLILAVTLPPAKVAFEAPRPITVLGDEVIVIGKLLGRESFPSGHTAVAFLAAQVLWCGLRRRSARPLVLALALACGLSRVVVGAHGPRTSSAASGWAGSPEGSAYGWPRAFPSSRATRRS